MYFGVKGAAAKGNCVFMSVTYHKAFEHHVNTNMRKARDIGRKEQSNTTISQAFLLMDCRRRLQLHRV